MKNPNLNSPLDTSWVKDSLNTTNIDWKLPTSGGLLDRNIRRKVSIPSYQQDFQHLKLLSPRSSIDEQIDQKFKMYDVSKEYSQMLHQTVEWVKDHPKKRNRNTFSLT